MGIIQQLPDYQVIRQAARDAFGCYSPKSLACQVLTSLFENGSFFAELNHLFSGGIGINHWQAGWCVLWFHGRSNGKKEK